MGFAWVEWLPEGLRYAKLLGIEGWQWIGLAVLLAASFLLGMVLRTVLATLFGLTRRIRESQVSVASGRGVRRAIAWLTAGLLWATALPSLHLEGSVDSFLDTVLTVVIVGSFTWLVAAIWDVSCDVYAHRQSDVLSRRATHLVIPLVRRFVRFIVLTLGGVFLVSSLGYDVSALIAGLGIGGVALALAAKDSVENLFGSLTIVMDMPFQVGDWIKIGTVDGVVEEINLRSTRVRTFDDSLITLPNSNLIKASVENMGARRLRRFRSSLLLTGQNTAENLEQFLRAGRALLAANDKVRQADASLTINDFADNGLRVQLIVYLDVPTYAQELVERETIILGLIEAASAAGVAFQGLQLVQAVPPASG